MEPDVIRVFSSSPPPLDEAGEEEEEDEFGEFGSFGGEGVSSSFSFSELDTPTTFNQSNALEDLPPDLYNTSMRNHTLPGKSGWANERMKESQFYESSKTEPSGDKTETHNCVKNTGMEAAEILMNGVTSPDLEEEFSDESSVTSSGQHSPQVLPEKLLRSTGNEHSLCNGFSESDQDSDSPTFLQSTETGVNSGLDDVVSGSELEGKQTINHTDSLQDSDTHSSYKEEFEPGETRAEVKLDEEEAPITAGSSCDEHFVVCDDTGFLEESKDCVDIAETAMGRIKEVDLISDTQLHRDTRETHGSSANTAVEVDKDINAFNETPADLTADEDFGDFRDATQGFADVSQTESITQDGFADFVTAMSRCSTDDEFGDTDTLKDFKEDEELEEEKPADLASAEGAFCSELPPSDSFADFSSAPFGGVAVGENWATFEQHESTEEGQDSWAEFGEEHSTFVYNEKQDVTSAVTSSDNLQSSRTNRDANLFQTAFPSDVRPEVSEVTEILTLQQVLQVQDHQEQKDQSCSFAQGNASAMWHHLEDIHGTYGLKIKWAGSHSNRLLLDCLGIRNILFTGDKKQPMIVPAFAAGLGMLEPTKESQKSPASPALSSTAPLGSGDILCTQVLQVASCSAVSVDAQDGGISELNLDYFGPVDESSSDSENDTPLPGVDPELYELTTAKMENNTNGRSIADAFTKLMESMDKNRTTARKPEKDEKMSEEAARVISHLPDLSFMKARVLMFPPVLTPSANHT